MKKMILIKDSGLNLGNHLVCLQRWSNFKKKASFQCYLNLLQENILPVQVAKALTILSHLRVLNTNLWKKNYYELY